MYGMNSKSSIANTINRDISSSSNAAKKNKTAIIPTNTVTIK